MCQSFFIKLKFKDHIFCNLIERSAPKARVAKCCRLSTSWNIASFIEFSSPAFDCVYPVYLQGCEITG